MSPAKAEFQMAKVLVVLAFLILYSARGSFFGFEKNKIA
jgi:uncharacterized membrane protein